MGPRITASMKNRGVGEHRYSSTLSLTSALDGVSRHRHAPSVLPPVPIVQEAGWVPGPVWTGAENLAPTGIRSPDRPSRSESLYRLSYRGSLVNGKGFECRSLF
jgi:hypothetical protein